ncbi:hypothetical protein MGS_03028 [Candida albicans P78042]|nr:hypothetical protein MG7_03039 [Candida albicans P34048]KHC78745.1 hypothetical protein MGS_03028 [Candida albicans P78042]
MFLIIPLIMFSLLSIGQSLFIPTTTTTTTTITIEADNSNLITLSTGPQLIENENYIKITKSIDLNQLFRKYPRGEIVNDFNDVDDLNARIFIFDMANLLEDLFE